MRNIFAPNASLAAEYLTEASHTALQSLRSNRPQRKKRPTPYRDTPPQGPDRWPNFDTQLEFQRCRGCDEAIVCSKTCAENANEYHSALCCSGAEEMIRKIYMGRIERAERERTKPDAATQRVFNSCRINPHERCLHDLLFARILGLSAQVEVHPLAHSDVRWLDGGLGPAPAYPSRYATSESDHSLSAYKLHDQPMPIPPSASRGPISRRKSLPWTFTHNVVLPARYMMEIGLEPFLNLEWYEGWVVNTLYAKIQHSTRVMKGAKHGKVFDDYGELYADVELGDGDVGREHWVGSLGYLTSMLDVEGEEESEGEGKGRRVNVRIEEGTEVRVFVVGKEDGKEGANGMGDSFGRPASPNDGEIMLLDPALTDTTPQSDTAMLEMPSSVATLSRDDATAAETASSTQSTAHTDADRMDWMPSSPITSTTLAQAMPSSALVQAEAEGSYSPEERAPVLKAGELYVRSKTTNTCGREGGEVRNGEAGAMEM